ncbi:MAG: DUF2794 domain-containing protein [Stellaceae bacterium]
MSLKRPRYPAPPARPSYRLAGTDANRARLPAFPRALDAAGEIADTARGGNHVRILMTSPQSATVLVLGDYRPRHRTTYFTRTELHQLLGLYSRQVARAVWRDYAIDHRDGVALFSVFRHSYEAAAYHIVKMAGAGPPQFVVLSGRQRLLSSRSLAEVLDYFRPRLTLLGVGAC